jgi:hypothetical protein
MQESYNTLSHRWGVDLLITLTAENFQQFLSSIPISMLPKTFQDAIEVTRKLGARYLWIDSLCTMQSGNGSAEDWERESSTMHKVYNNAFCDIAARAASNPSSGLFFDRPSILEPAKLTVKWESFGNDKRPKRFQGRYTIIDGNLWANQVTMSPLVSRFLAILPRNA